MPATPTLSLCDKLVELIRTSWQPAAPDQAERVYEAPIDAAKKGLGRRVYLFPATYTSEPADRGKDLYTHKITALCVERYEEAGRPPVAWIDDRVDFVYEQLFQGLDFGRNGPLIWGDRSVVTRGIDPVDLYDAAYLVQAKTFWCELTFDFDEILSG